MSEKAGKPVCPHCGSPLRAFRMPEESAWGAAPHLACFNDDCPYFREGWDWMRDNFCVRASYRYRITGAEGGQVTPLAVWSETAFLDRIIEERR